MASFHSKDNYETLRDIISEVYPIKTNDGLHGVYDTNFRVFSPPSNHSLLAANQLFLEKVMRNLDTTTFRYTYRYSGNNCRSNKPRTRSNSNK
jgi:hypothetical protein